MTTFTYNEFIDGWVDGYKESLGLYVALL